MNNSNPQVAGRVYLVGAGPGDPQLITLRAVQCLRRADVILYDYLVNSRILQHAGPQAEQICLGRHGGSRFWPQSEISERLVDLARQGKTVVRLKAGDPVVFARMAEEAERLLREGIPCEIVPGITAGLAAGSYAGIPLTHRDLASAVALITGQEKPGKSSSALDFDALARFPGTLVFYMGVTTADQWTRELIRAGKPPETPATIVRRCSFPDQLTIRCRLDEVPERMAGPEPICPPAVVIVGPVSAAGYGFDWVERRPLFGQTILVTRPADQGRETVDQLSELGAQVVVQPAIRIAAPSDWDRVDAAIARLDAYDWLVFSSSNGVQYFLDRLLAGQGDLRRLGGVRLAAIGPGTAEALAEYRLKADLVPGEYRSEALADALAQVAAGKRVLLARASRGREVLAERLRAAGADVDQVVVYCSSDVTTLDPDVESLLAAGRIDWITVTSSAIARSLAGLCGQWLRTTPVVSISPVTSETLRGLGVEPAAEAGRYTLEGVIAAILDACPRKGPTPGRRS
jgi:uroporphyrinogen III methyltransferase/synthase